MTDPTTPRNRGGRPKTLRDGQPLRNYSVYLTASEAEVADRLAADLGCLNERGEPSRSALFVRLVEDEVRGRGLRAKKSGDGME
jgi:hypothetical protein